MKWKAITLLLVVLIFSACTAQVDVPSTADAGTSSPSEATESKSEEGVDQAETMTEESENSAHEPAANEATALPIVSVYKSPTCGCCIKWVEHMEENGFVVESHDVEDLALVKADNDVPGQLQSCHTAIIDGYVVEGHVPAEDVNRLLLERPEIAGLAVPGMPVGSPGMEASGYPAQPFDVISFDSSGKVEIYTSHNE